MKRLCTPCTHPEWTCGNCSTAVGFAYYKRILKERDGMPEGVLVAPDNAVMWWNLRGMPGAVGYYDTKGKPIGPLISGEISDRDLARYKRNFLREHSGQGRLL